MSAFCEPETTTSIPQASVSSGTAPSDETASTTSDRVADRRLDRAARRRRRRSRSRTACRARARRPLRAPPRRSRRDRAPRPTRSRCAARRDRGARRSSIQRSPNAPATTTATWSPGPAGSRPPTPSRRCPEALKSSTSELGAEHLLEPLERPRVDLAKVSAAVVDHRLGAGGEHLGRHGRRARREQVALLQGLQPSAAAATAQPDMPRGQTRGRAATSGVCSGRGCPRP